MSQTSYTKAPLWNNDGILPNDVSSGVYYTSPMGFIAPMPGMGSIPVTSMTWSGGVVSANIVGHNLVTGSSVLITGVTPAGYNGYYASVTVVDANNITFPLTVNPGTVTVEGVLNKGYEVVIPIGGLDVVNADLNVAPTFTAVATYSNLAHMVTGDIYTVTLTASEPIDVQNISATTTPFTTVVIGVNTRDVLFNAAASTSTSLVFHYTIVAGDTAALGAVTGGTTITPNGAIFLDVAGSNGTHSAPFTPAAFTAPVTSSLQVN